METLPRPRAGGAGRGLGEGQAIAPGAAALPRPRAGPLRLRPEAPGPADPFLARLPAGDGPGAGPHRPAVRRPAARRLDAEQIVDSLFAATGKPFRLEEVSLDIDGLRNMDNSITLGRPRRSWMLTSTSNERDRPSLALPRIQAVADVLQAFGWRGARQEPISMRDLSPNVLQPAILSNGTMGGWLTRLSDDHGVTKLALEERPLDGFLDELFLRMLTRPPTAQERKTYVAYLREGYEKRIVAPVAPKKVVRQPEPYVSWSNQHDPQATIIKQQ